MEPPVRAAEPAATVVPIRDGENGIEVLMLRRNAAGTFAGMWVFPGGRIDPDDADDEPDELSTARRAAAREALEEAGLVFVPRDLVAYSHWSPPEGVERRFPTWFFLAAVRDAAEVLIDGVEIHDHAWVTAEQVMRRRDDGEVQLAPPTWMTLRHLSGFAAVDEVLAFARSREPEVFVTRIHRDGEVLIATWAGDAAYGGGGLHAEGGRRRLIMDPSGWRAEVRP